MEGSEAQCLQGAAQVRLRGEAGEDRTPARRRPEFLVLETSLPLLRCLCFIGFLLSESFRFTVQRVPGRPPPPAPRLHLTQVVPRLQSTTPPDGVAADRPRSVRRGFRMALVVQIAV